MDQAAGLRNWVSNHQESAHVSVSNDDTLCRHAAPTHTLMVVGLPNSASTEGAPVIELLDHWRALGYRWVGSPDRWRVVPIDLEDSHLATLASHQPRWALWVDADANAFRRAYSILRQLHARQGPRRLIAVHSSSLTRRGLLENLQAAASHLGIELLVLTR